MGAEATVEVPAQSNEVHHEIEWVVALSKGGKNIPEHIAWEYVAGWSVGIDFTLRTSKPLLKQVSHGRSPKALTARSVSPFTPKPRFSPLHLGDYQLELTVNGRIRQRDTLSSMFTLPELIHYLSTLLPFAQVISYSREPLRGIPSSSRRSVPFLSPEMRLAS